MNLNTKTKEQAETKHKLWNELSFWHFIQLFQWITLPKKPYGFLFATHLKFAIPMRLNNKRNKKWHN